MKLKCVVTRTMILYENVKKNRQQTMNGQAFYVFTRLKPSIKLSYQYKKAIWQEIL